MPRGASTSAAIQTASSARSAPARRRAGTSARAGEPRPTAPPISSRANASSLVHAGSTHETATASAAGAQHDDGRDQTRAGVGRRFTAGAVTAIRTLPSAVRPSAARPRPARPSRRRPSRRRPSAAPPRPARRGQRRPDRPPSRSARRRSRAHGEAANAPAVHECAAKTRGVPRMAEHVDLAGTGSGTPSLSRSATTGPCRGWRRCCRGRSSRRGPVRPREDRAPRPALLRRAGPRQGARRRRSGRRRRPAPSARRLAVAIRTPLTWSGVSAGFASMIRAVTPETTAAAWDVPEPLK